MKARIVEIFSSLQGEGVRLGERQIFVRFGGCNLHCDYCDEPETIPIPSGRPWGRDCLQKRILQLQKERAHRSVSWTGGEPLLHAGFLREMMPWARDRGLENYLETNGTLADALRPLAPLCDQIAMDVKLPSALIPRRVLWSAHRRFLEVCPEKTFVKVVLTDRSTPSEWARVLELMGDFPQVPLVLQPATPIGPVRSIEPALAAQFLERARDVCRDVRLVPQWHPIWNLP